MRKYKVNRTEPKKVPSKETIEKYKDFSRLSHAYDEIVKRPKKPLYRDKKMFLFLLIVALLAYVIAQSVKEDKKDEPKDDKEKTELKQEPARGSESHFVS